MGDALAEILFLAPFRIHVMRVEIAALASVQNDIGVRQGPAKGMAPRTHFIVFIVLRAHLKR
jgi:hypothetical protein